MISIVFTIRQRQVCTAKILYPLVLHKKKFKKSLIPRKLLKCNTWTGGLRIKILQKVVTNIQANILWEFQIQNDKLVMANQHDVPYVEVVEKHQKTAAMVDVES